MDKTLKIVAVLTCVVWLLVGVVVLSFAFTVQVKGWPFLRSQPEMGLPQMGVPPQEKPIQPPSFKESPFEQSSGDLKLPQPPEFFSIEMNKCVAEKLGKDSIEVIQPGAKPDSEMMEAIGECLEELNVSGE
jgi:hypothetical protein